MITIEQINEIFDKRQFYKIDSLNPNKLSNKIIQHILMCLHYYKIDSNFVNRCKLYNKL